VDAARPVLQFDWSRTAEVPDNLKSELEADIQRRMAVRSAWLQRLEGLIDDVERWARELDWSTRRITKQIDDDEIGRHTVPALLMQQETCRILLEPIGRSTPGSEGLVDLYLMPAYDDIASLTCRDGRWYVHDDVPESQGRSLSKSTLQSVLEEMIANASSG
jgi:hypothetical protein